MLLGSRVATILEFQTQYQYPGKYSIPDIVLDAMGQKFTPGRLPHMQNTSKEYFYRFHFRPKLVAKAFQQQHLPRQVGFMLATAAGSVI